MPAIDFEERDMYARVPDPNNRGDWSETLLRWRRDPLTGASARILTGVKLQPKVRPDLSAMMAPPAFCPFDAANIESTTFEFPREIAESGRIHCGRAVIVPNVMAYATHSAVGVYDPDRHFMELDSFAPALLADALTAMVQHAQAVRRVDPAAQWSSISSNHLAPAGASLVHPHLQSAHDAYGLTGQRHLVECSRQWAGGGASYWSRLIDTEEGGPRWIARTGRVGWLTPFAPSGFHEVWGLVRGASDVDQLSRKDCLALGEGMSNVLRSYYSNNLASFNFGIIGGGPDARRLGHQVLVKIVSRSNPEPMYRSDVTFFERIHGEALLDLSPEDVAAAVRGFFTHDPATSES